MGRAYRPARPRRHGGIPRGLPALVLAAGILLGPTQSADAQVETLTLEEAVDRALRDSPELRHARLGLTAAERQVAEARGQLLPRVDLSLRYSRNLSPPSTFLPAILFDPGADPDDLIRVDFGADNVWTTSLVAEQPLFEARALTAVRASNRFADLQDEVVRGRTHEVITGVRVLYHDVLLAREQARLMESSLERVQESLRETRALEEEGLASEYDVLRLEVEIANLEPRVRRAQNAEVEGARELAVVLGMEATTELRLVGSLARMDINDPAANDLENRSILDFAGAGTDAGAGGLRSQARGGRSEIRQLEFEESLRRAELRAEQADFLPRLSLFGNYDIQAQQDGSPDFFGRSEQRGYGRVLGLQITIPVFAGFQRTARADRARAELRRTETRRELLAERTDADVATLAERLDEARTRAAALRRAVEQAERGYRIVRAQFAEGLASQIEVTDAEIAIRESEFNYAEAVHEYLTTRARLDAVTGQVPGVGLP